MYQMYPYVTAIEYLSLFVEVMEILTRIHVNLNARKNIIKVITYSRRYLKNIAKVNGKINFPLI